MLYLCTVLKNAGEPGEAEEPQPSLMVRHALIARVNKHAQNFTEGFRPLKPPTQEKVRSSILLWATKTLLTNKIFKIMTIIYSNCKDVDHFG